MTEISTAITNMYNQGRHSEVVDFCSKYSVNSKSNPFLAQILGASLFSLGKHSEAQNVLTTLESSFGNNPDFLSLYAANSRRLGDFAKAKQTFLAALEIDPENCTIKNNYANLLVDQELYVEAQEILKSILLAQPDYVDAKLNLERVNKILSAINSCDKNETPVSAADSPSVNALHDPLLLAFNRDEIDFCHSRYLSQFKDDKSKKKFAGLPNSSSDKLLLEQLDAVRLSIDNNNPALALKLCSKVVLHMPENALVYEYAADAYLLLKQFHQSEICLLRSLMLGGASLKHYFNMITFSRMRKDYGQAYFYFKKACSVDPSSPQLVKIKSLIDEESRTQNDSLFPEKWVLPD